MEEKENSFEKTKSLLKNITFEQRKKLIDKLHSAGFKFVSLGHVGHVEVERPKKGHPQTEGKYLPVASIRYRFKSVDNNMGYDVFCDSYVELVNLDKKFPENYHAKLEAICVNI